MTSKVCGSVDVLPTVRTTPRLTETARSDVTLAGLGTLCVSMIVQALDPGEDSVKV